MDGVILRNIFGGMMVQNSTIKSQSFVNMLFVMYLWLPMIFNLLITPILLRLKVEKVNKELQK